MKKLLLLTIVVVLAVLSACTPSPVDDVTPMTDGAPPETVPETPEAVVMASGLTLQSEKTRIEVPEISKGDRDKLADGNGAFAFDLYRQLKDRDGNLFFSPYSISAALAMTYAGAGGTTAAQMAAAMHFNLPQDELHPAFNWLDGQLASRGEGAEGKDGEGFRLNVVNAIWGQKDYEFKVAFLDTLAEHYDAGLRILDFINEPDESRVTINDWVSRQTEDRIKDLIPPGGIDTLTRLVLTNAIYFNAAWESKFTEEATRDLPFYPLNGESVSVPMMRNTETFGYTEGDDYQAVELPYDGRELSMVIMLPSEGKFNEFEDALDYDTVDRIIDKLDEKSVRLTIPKFEFESEFRLGKALSALGMTEAFSGSADFSGMTDNEGLFIGSVIHKAFVLVEEGGTEAAAATAVVMAMSAPGTKPEEPVVFTADRPFIFLIRDIETGAILFVGRVVNTEAMSNNVETPQTAAADELLEAVIYAEHHGITADEAMRRFEIQEAFAGLDTELSIKEPETFAGLYIQHEPEFRIVVLFTHDGEATIKPYIPEGTAGYVEVRTARFSFLEMQNAQREVSAALRSLGIPADSGIYVMDNNVEFRVTDLAAIEKATNDGGLTVPDCVVFTEVEGLAVPD